MSKLLRPLIAILFLCLGSFAGLTPVYAVENFKETKNPLSGQASLTPFQIGAGQTIDLKIQLFLAKGYKAYEDQFKISIIKPEGFKVGAIQISPIKEFFDKFSNKKRTGIDGNANLNVVIEAPNQLSSGSDQLEIELSYQACTDTFCLFPQIIKLNAAFENKSVNIKNSSFLDQEFKDVIERGLALTFLFVFAMGILTSFTPCIFPMIPITLSVLGQHAHAKTRWQNFIVSNMYVLGIALTYSIMGVVAASTGALFGSFMSHPIVLGFMCFVFLAMALSMFGLYDLQPPAFIQNRFASTSDLNGYSGAFFSGVISGVVASPCVGPVLVAILTFIAKSQNLWLGFFLMFTYALGMGQIFLVLGLFSQLTKFLPKSGAWLDGIKHLFGTLMIGVFYYFLNLLVPLRIWDISLGVGIIIGAVYFGLFSVPKNNFQKIKKAFMQAAIIIGSFFLLLGGFNLRPMLQQKWIGQTPGYTVKANNWIAYSDAELKNAIAAGKPVIIDFRADWCAACIEMEELTFTNQRFQLLSTKFVLLKFDATKESNELSLLREKYEIVGLPTLLFFNSKGELQKELTLTAFEEADKFIERMMKATKN